MAVIVIGVVAYAGVKNNIGFGNNYRDVIYRFTYIYDWLQTGVKNTIFKRLI